MLETTPSSVASNLPASTGVREMVDRLVRFDGPPELFLRELLQAQCSFAGVEAGAVIRIHEPGQDANPQGGVEVLASHPALSQRDTPPVWLASAVQLLREDTHRGDSSVHPLPRPNAVYGQDLGDYVILVPTRGTASLQGFEAFFVRDVSKKAVEGRRQRLELSLSLLSLYEMRQALMRRDAELRGVSTATRVLSASNSHQRFRTAALAFCNEIASRFQAERVSLGVLSGRYVKLRAMSQTEHVNRKMALVQSIESAMEECVDQDEEVLFPPPPDAGTVTRQAAELARAENASTVVTLPLRRAGEAVGAVTVEKAADQPLTLEQLEFLRMACDLCGPRLLEKDQSDRWFGYRWAQRARSGLAVLVGPTHTWAKAAAIGLLAAALCLTLIQMEYRVDAPFAFEATTQRVVPAPFDGYLKRVEVEPGDDVVQGDLLGVLDTTELQLNLAQARKEQAVQRLEASSMRREGKTVEAQIAQAQADKAEADVKLYEHQIGQARLVAPIDGVVVIGDLRQKINAPVRRGDVMFEVAPLEEQRAVAMVADTDITDLQPGMVGELAAAAQPSDRLAFEVEHINPVAEADNEDNVFRVRLRLDETRPWIRPGQEGVAKVDAGQAAIGWIWTREALNWLRLKLWL